MEFILLNSSPASINEIIVSTDTIWVLLAAVLVMFMQPGFALVEAGFTRSKNTANIIMKNIMDFSVGSLIFWIAGFTLMYGDDLGGFIGKASLFFNSEAVNGIPDKASLMFQTVFAATAATIVSGTMAERTKFSTYLIFTIAITAIIYPVSGHWVWGGGWLSQLETPFHDFAGSTVVHSVGAISVHGLAGAAGTILVGLFSTSGGLFYGGGTDLLISQLIGVGAVAAWSMTLGFLVFRLLRATIGIRVPGRVEEEGLDVYEHGEATYNTL